ncbi:MAG: orotidine-5'-phosphate decarboxylase [Phycisphaeraceae bacterium]|nr:orotidine-5'-phosphate decarboxylase [Phycisphaeraceae bacterium]
MNPDDEVAPSDRLEARIRALEAPVCVGLDPVFARLPEVIRTQAPSEVEAIERFSVVLLDAVEGVVPAVKPQAACFERYGAAGYLALERVMKAARGRFEIILDWKRGDIGVSSEHYAAGAVALGADWVTASPYLGLDGVRPFLDAGLGVFALVRTSNADGDRVQSRRLDDGEGGTVAEAVAALIASEGERWVGASGLSSLGAVVGATKFADAARLRALMPKQIFLVPGYGAQGAGPREAAACFRADGSGALITASRSVIYAFEPGDRAWSDSVRAAAEAFARDIAQVVHP